MTARSGNAGIFWSQVVVVTGAASGIGRGIALAFAAEGATVYGIDVDQKGLGRLVGDLDNRAGRLRTVVADVASEVDVRRVVQTVVDEASRVDVLVNNAGINMDKRLADLDRASWDRVIDTNLKGVYLFSRGFWDIMRSQRSGAIVNVSSVMGQVGGVGSPAYCATKAAIIMFSRCLAKDGAQYGIRVNSVCPGYIDTPIMDRVLAATPDPEVARRDLVGRMPLGRMGATTDIASGVLFLASSSASYISGTELTIDGAVTATQID